MDKYPEHKTVGNISCTIYRDHSWMLQFPNGTELDGIGNPFTSVAFNAIREDFINEIGRINADWLKKFFDENYDTRIIKADGKSVPDIQFAVTQTRKFFRIRLKNGFVSHVTIWELNNKFTVSDPCMSRMYTNDYLLPKANYRLPKPEGLDADIIEFLRDHPCLVLGK